LGLIPAETLENVRARLDIVELVSEYVPGLQRAGRNMKGRCPFHQERTPSFIVSAERQTYHCFGCGEGGDAFKFVMKMENLGFTDAVEKLAERVGIKIEKAEDLSPEAKDRLKLKELYAFAAEWYHDRLVNGADAEAARRYLSSRHVSPKAVVAWKLGYSPRQSAFVDAAMKKGWLKEQLLKAGLAAPSKQNPGTIRDYFFDRVMYPIFDAKGGVVAFGGRTLGDGEPKYLNSPENPLFSKSRVLYGLSQAAPTIRKSRKALLMEGYMDVIATHQHGLAVACAPLGTALTVDHASLLSRYCTDVVIVFDSDSAGLNAAVRGAELLLAKGFGVRIATIVEGKDPDELLHEKGVPAFEACLKNAVDLVEFKTELLLKKQAYPLTPEAKSAVAKDVLATIEQSPDEVLKAEWINRLAQRLHVPVEAISKQGTKVLAVQNRYQRPAGQTPARPTAAEAAVTGPDEELLLYLLKQPKLSLLPTETDFASTPAQNIWKALRAQEPWPADWSLKLLEAVNPAERAAAQKMLLKADDMSKDELEARVTRALEKGRRERRYEELRRMLREGQAVDASVTAEFIRLTAELKGSAVKA
jgi:DNA primase